MSTAEELLMGASPTSTQTDSSDTDNALYVDVESRKIQIPTSVVCLGVESDDDVKKLTFNIPRFYHDTDLAGFKIYINYLNAIKEGDLFEVLPENVVIDDAGTLTFDWVVGRNALAYKGNVIFSICMKKVSETETDEDGAPIIIQEFNSTIATLPVLEGLETSSDIAIEYSDIFMQWQELLFGIEDSAKANIVSKGNEIVLGLENYGGQQISAIEQKSNTVLQAIQNEGTTQENAVIQKGEEVTNTIATKKTEFDNNADTKIAALNTAGENQKTAIEQKGTEVLENLDEQLPAGIESYITAHPNEFKGDKGEKGDPGTDGVDGKDGTSVNILGSYSTEAELRAAHPTGAKDESYMVNGDLYIWDLSTSDWKNVGRIQGPKGDPGNDGVSPTITETKTGKVTTITITDVNGTQTFTINDGADGDGSGDMTKATYDTNNSGIVDDSEKLGGVEANKYALKTDIPDEAETAKDSEKLGGKTPDYYAKATDILSELVVTDDGDGNITITLGGNTNG